MSESFSAKSSESQRLTPPVRHDHADCVAHVLATARRMAEDEGMKFTPLREAVLRTLLEAHRAMGAYDLIDALSTPGQQVKPPVIYRTLTFLIEKGFVHKIEGLNAFVACPRPDLPHEPCFIICKSCKEVAESTRSPSGMASQGPPAGFRVEQRIEEVIGTCAECEAQSGEGTVT